MSKRFIPIICFMLFSLYGKAQVIINEIMQSNIDCVMDNLNEFPDSWVELYNAGSTTVNLQEYQLGASANVNEAWQLPKYNLAPQQFILVYCDKEETGWHTNFRLETSKGGEVYLFHSGSIIDQLRNLPKQPAPNISYGRITDGATSWGYQLTPSPKATNASGTANEILGEPIFSEEGRVLTSATTLTLTISLPEGTPQGTVIRYTTDGSEPIATSSLYSSPLKISSTKVIRAKLFCNGYLSPRSTTHSYIFLSRSMNLPIISMVTNDKYINDNKIGIYVDGTYSTTKKNYLYDWRRPINLEYFTKSGQPSVINQLCETRLQGGASREMPIKSQIIYANKRFGNKRFSYEFFPDQRPGITDFKSLVLRNAGNDFSYLYMRDAVIQRTMASRIDLDWQAWQPAIVYLNGVYHGIINIRERSTADNIYTHYNGLEDIDMIENWNELKEGDTEYYTRFKAFYTENGHTMAEYEQWMDCKEFINLMAMNLYYCNLDFPGNNIVMWRPRTADGKWRFVAKDTDFGLGLYDYPATYRTIEWIYDNNFDSRRATANKPQHTLLFRQLMEDPDFRREFIDHTAIYMGDFMNAKGTRELWDGMYDLIKAEYPYHRDCVRQWWPRFWPHYTEELTKAQQWVTDRTDIFYQQLDDFYHLGTPTPLTINQGLNDDDKVKIKFLFNEVPLSKGTFDGKFFLGRSITLRGKRLSDKRVKGWKVTTTTSSGTSTQTINSPIYTFNMPSCKSLSINAILEITTALLGDVNNDGIVNTSDAVCLTNYILGLNPKPFIIDAADVNEDGIINISDIVSLMRIILNA